MRNRSGFTAIELLIVVVLVGIFASIAIPRFSSNQRTAYTTARKIVSDIRYARSLSISTGNAHYLQFFQVSGSYREYKIFDNLNAQIGDTRIIPEIVTCTLSASTFTFNYLGVCNSGSGTDTVTLNDGFETSSVIVVDMTGRASY